MASDRERDCCVYLEAASLPNLGVEVWPCGPKERAGAVQYRGEHHSRPGADPYSSLCWCVSAESVGRGELPNRIATCGSQRGFELPECTGMEPRGHSVTRGERREDGKEDCTSFIVVRFRKDGKEGCTSLMLCALVYRSGGNAARRLNRPVHLLL